MTMETNIELFEKFRRIPMIVYNRSYRGFSRYREDLEQEGALRLWYSIGKLDQTLSEGEQASYLYRSVSNAMHNYIFRKQYKHDSHSMDLDFGLSIEASENDAYSSVKHRDLFIDFLIVEALERALLHDRWAFKRYVEAKSIAVIAAEEGLTPAQVNYRLRLFKERVRAIVFRKEDCFDIEDEVYSSCQALRGELDEKTSA